MFTLKLYYTSMVFWYNKLRLTDVVEDKNKRADESCMLDDGGPLKFDSNTGNVVRRSVPVKKFDGCFYLCVKLSCFSVTLTLKFELCDKL